mgnify:CR=1 FL=1
MPHRYPQSRASKEYSKAFFEHLVPEALEYLKKSFDRINDPSSRVLVTGDLNAGKSTLINALINHEYLPTDQQPCTQAFCEVLMAKNQEHAGKVYASLTDPKSTDKSAMKEITFADLRKYLQNDDSGYKWFRLYTEGVDSSFDKSQIDVSFIDSPGLNTDVVKTTSLFCQQGDIDVIVFVVNAAYHLTLSGREFLQTAARDKGKMFIIVNRFDEIIDQKRCSQLIFKQIKELLPVTYVESRNFVHFISAKRYSESLNMDDFSAIEQCPISVQNEGSDTNFRHDFVNMRRSLFEFIYLRRSISKLQPAKTFVLKLLHELFLLCSMSFTEIDETLRSIDIELAERSPKYDTDLKSRPALCAETEDLCRNQCKSIASESRECLASFFKSIHTVIYKDSCTSVFTMPRYLRQVYGGLNCEYRQMMTCLNQLTINNLTSGRESLLVIANRFNVAPAPISGFEHVYTFSPRLSLSRLSFLDLFEPFDLFRNFGMLNVVSLASAVAGYQPFLTAIWKISHHLQINPVVLGGAAFTTAGIPRDLMGPI